MANQISADEKNRILFMHLVTMFETAAWQHLGKIQNPLTGKIEKDLEQARFSIDVLDMLLVRTQGNLSDEERRYLEDRIRNLKLNFVDEVEKERKRKEEEQKKAKEQGQQGTASAEGQTNAETKSSQEGKGGEERKSEETVQKDTTKRDDTKQEEATS